MKKIYFIEGQAFTITTYGPSLSKNITELINTFGSGKVYLNVAHNFQIGSMRINEVKLRIGRSHAELPLPDSRIHVEDAMFLTGLAREDFNPSDNNATIQGAEELYGGWHVSTVAVAKYYKKQLQAASNPKTDYPTFVNIRVEESNFIVVIQYSIRNINYGRTIRRHPSRRW